MTVKYIPLADHDRQNFVVRLGQDNIAECRVYLWWQPLDDSWYFSLDVWGIRLCTSRRVTVNAPLLPKGVIETDKHFDGELWCRPSSDLDGNHDPRTRDAFWRRTHNLTWEIEDDVAF